MDLFNYSAPTDLAEAFQLLDEFGDDLRPLAGGTDLLPQLRSGKFAARMVMDIKRIPEMMSLRRDGDRVTIGAGMPCADLYESDECKSAFPGVVDSLIILGGIQIQSRAGMGGNLCNSSPSADTICPLIVHDAVAVIASGRGTRSLAARDFCVAPGKNVLEQDEILLAIEIPVAAADFGAAYQRFTPRNEMDIAVAAVAAAVTLSADHSQFEEAKIALAGVAPTPLVAEQAENALRGAPTSDEAIRAAAELAAAAAKPIDDMRGSVQHRRQLIAALTERVVGRAIERCKARNNSK